MVRHSMVRHSMVRHSMIVSTYSVLLLGEDLPYLPPRILETNPPVSLILVIALVLIHLIGVYKGSVDNCRLKVLLDQSHTLLINMYL